VYLLDSNTTSDFLDANRSYDNLRARILSVPFEDLYVSVITVIENLGGMIGRIQRAWNDPRLVERCAEFEALFRHLAVFQVAAFDAAALERFEAIPAAHRRRHGRDSRIAAIALSRGYTVVTRNTVDFTPSGVDCVSWH
jgi:predicted nucleic acid-binding protein